MRAWTIPLGCLLMVSTTLAKSDEDAGKAPPTHEQVGTIDVESGRTINTFCMDQKGRLLVAVSAASTKDEEAKGSVLVYSADGKLKQTWDLPLTPTAVNVSPSGTIFVAGGGQIAKLDENGQILKQATTPQIEDMESFREQIRAQIIESQKSRAAVYETQITQAEELIASLQEKPEEDRSAIDKLRLKNAERQLKLIKDAQQRSANPDPESIDVDRYMASRLKVPGLAVSDQDVFVAVYSLKGYGYDVWRMDHNFYNPKSVVSGLRGCCGQMDIQCCNDCLYVAENSRHRVCKFDRDGEELATWGKSDRSGKDGFTGCCNPMNLRFGKDGEVLTAESGVGAIKRYTADGEFVGLLGNANLQGGCKHVAIAATPDGKKLFMLDITRSRIAVLEEKPAEVSDEPSTTGAE